VTQICLLTALTFSHAIRLLSPVPAAWLLIWSVLISFGAEAWGVHSSWLFYSSYNYAAYLGPQLIGVPLIIPTIWFMLCYQAVVYSRVLRIESWPCPARLLLRTLACNYVLLAIDLLLEPVGTGLQAWKWQVPGWYYSTPLGNFIGWFLVGTVIFSGYFALELQCRPRPREDSKRMERLSGLMPLATQLPLVVMALFLGCYLGVLLFLGSLVWVCFLWHQHVHAPAVCSGDEPARLKQGGWLPPSVGTPQ
jgi:uncharacterized membrane protein